MIVIRFVSFAKTQISYEFHCGTGKIHTENACDVVYAYCDGHELTHALSILGRPNTNQRSHKFFGDSAKEIVANWLSHK